MEQILGVIEQILREEDVEGYIESGAPSDEYSSEAEEIMRFFQLPTVAPLTEGDVFERLLQIWEENFNLADEELRLRHPALLRVTKRIMK